MEWERAVEEERALGRIVALLCALAVLAEQAAGRSAVVRTVVLWFLRYAEAVARDFVMGELDEPSAPMPPAGSGPLDAVRLAISFRALARELDRQARRLSATCRRAGGEPDASPCGRMPARRNALAVLSRLAALVQGAPHPIRAPDTS